MALLMHCFLPVSAVSNSRLCNVERWRMSDTLGRIWKDMVMALIEVLSWHLPGGTGKTIINMASVASDLVKIEDS